jgi:radical SAM superfamily enzyme YgiQ (UPF0313 family)
MKVLFVSTNRFREFLMPMPLGLASIIAQIDESRHQIEVLDLMFSEEVEAEVKSTLSDFGPDVIAISIRNIDDQCHLDTRYFLPEAKEIVDLCRSNSAATIVIGGSAFTVSPIAIFGYLEPDFGVAGEGELVFAELLNRIEAKRDWSDLPGLVWRGSDGIEMNPLALIEDLDSLRIPRRDLFDNQRYATMGGLGNIVIKQGCSFDCLYCDSPHVMGRRWRMKSPEKVVAELESMERDLGIEAAFFTDAIFNIPLDHAKEVCRAIIRRGLGIKWVCSVNPAFADRELFELMREAGCTVISLGCDTASDKMLRVLRKGYTRETILKSAMMLEEMEINYALWFLIGAPGENRETVEETVRFVKERNPFMVGFHVGVRLMPNTDLFDIAVEEGVISADDPLMEPKFYVSPDVRDWVADYLSEVCSDNPRWSVSR